MLTQPNKPEYLTLKKDMMDEVVLKYAPPDILTRVRSSPTHGTDVRADICLVYDSHNGGSK